MAALFDGHESLLEPEALRDLPTLPERGYWLLHDIQALLGRAALEAPLLVCLDDLQWADSGTIAALRALPRPLAALPIAWVIAVRPEHEEDMAAAGVELTPDQIEQLDNAV